MSGTLAQSGRGGLKSDAKVIAIAVARIGDTLLVTPALRAIKAATPQGRLTVLAHTKRACLLEHLPFIDQLGSIDKRSALWRGRFAGRCHDLAIVWGSDRALVDYGLRCADRVVAFDAPGLPNHDRIIRVAKPQAVLHAVTERLLLAEAVGACSDDPHLAYRVSDAEKADARRWLDTLGVGKRLVGIQPVSFPTKAHRDWPVEHFAALLPRLAAAFPDLGFVVLGDAAAVDVARRLERLTGASVAVAAGKFDLRGSAALIGELDLYIGVDTGPTHLAGALNVPLVALYHCSYPGRNLIPLGHPALRMIEHPATGSATASIDRSMAEIPVEVVFAAAAEQLETPAPLP